MLRSLFVVLLLAVGQPAFADEVEDALNAALDAYRAGDIETAGEEAGFAQQLMAQMKASDLGGFLPAAPDGWTRKDGDTGAMPGLGGMMASATYTKADQAFVEVQLMADNQMVASMMMMFSNPMMLGQMGEVKRIGRQKAVLTRNGELQAMLDNNVLVQLSGEAPVEDMEMLFGLIDFEALEAF